MQKHINELNKIINELNNENQKIKEEIKENKLKDSKLNEYLEEKKIMEQKLQDNNNNKISELKKSKNLLKRGLKKQERINELKTKENNELKNEIKKLTKLNIEFSGLPTLFQDIEKKKTLRLELLLQLILIKKILKN